MTVTFTELKQRIDSCGNLDELQQEALLLQAEVCFSNLSGFAAKETPEAYSLAMRKRLEMRACLNQEIVNRIMEIKE